MSRVTPRTFGVLSRGRGDPNRGTEGLRRDWWVSGVKRVTDDFGTESRRHLSPTQDTKSEACGANASAVEVSVKSILCV